jgi:beta-mannosidase
VTSGLWRPVTLEAWDTVRIADLQVFQDRLDDAEAVLRVKVRLDPARPDRAATSRVRVRVSAALHPSQQVDVGATAAAAGAAGASAAVPAVAVRVAEAEVEAPLVAGGGDVTLGLRIAHPERWWPNGLGPQRLYDISASVRAVAVAGVGAVDRRTTRIGLRTLEVVHRRDAEGKSFTIEVNGAPVFMKGANWVPADSFLSRIPAERQRWLLESAAAANMNMVRVWGGGVYEDDRFYADCDELGLLVWQDFMFACSMYPGDAAFLDEVRHEAVENVRRLRNHPSLALWAGNNEIEAAWQGWGWPSKFNLSPAVQDRLWKDYRTLFHQLLPAIVAEEDPGRFYTRSSPSANEDDVHANQLGWGDMHYWGVWHAEKPYTDYASNTSRFMSEYGFQSFPELATVALYAAPSDWDIDGPVMLAHQRHPRGNALIRTYLARDFRRPRDFASFLYVGQVLQATIIEYAAEAHRRQMGRNWGSLYWQLDDCWPVASWSGIDYVGRWKALHYAARRFFAPVLVSVVEESGAVGVWGISDRRTELPAELTVRLVELSGRELWRRREAIHLGANQSRVYLSIPKREALGTADPARVVLVAELAARGERTSRAVFSFVKVKDLELPDPGVSLAVAAAGPNLFDVTVRAERFAKAVVLSMTDPASGRIAIDGFFDDNAFDLLPGETVTVHLRTRPPSTPPGGDGTTAAEAVAPTAEQVRAALRVMSIADSYAR